MINQYSTNNGRMAILITFLVAFALTILPMQETLRFFRPDWIAICLIYWCLFIPNRVGVFTAWFVGLLTDELTGALLGQHALTFSIIAYIAILLQHRTRHYPPWQQAITILTLLLLHRLLMHWILGITGFPPNTLLYMAPAFLSALLWPLIASLMNAIRKRYSIR